MDDKTKSDTSPEHPWSNKTTVQLRCGDLRMRVTCIQEGFLRGCYGFDVHAPEMGAAASRLLPPVTATSPEDAAELLLADERSVLHSLGCLERDGQGRPVVKPDVSPEPFPSVKQG